MTSRSLIVRAALGMTALVLIIAGVQTSLPYLRTAGGSCPACGAGDPKREHEVICACQYLSCPRCEGTGGRFHAGDFGRRYLGKILTMRTLVLNGVSDNPQLTFVIAGCLLSLGFLLWQIRVVRCRLCRETGRLSLEVRSPGEARRFVNLECVACQGRGGLTAIDRWVAGV